MSLRINHNISAINGHNMMLRNDAALSKSLERLSSGMRINRAADDAAGLVISEQMRAQIAGLGQAIDNSETAVSFVQTTEGALDEINSLLISPGCQPLDSCHSSALSRFGSRPLSLATASVLLLIRCISASLAPVASFMSACQGLLS